MVFQPLQSFSRAQTSVFRPRAGGLGGPARVWAGPRRHQRGAWPQYWAHPTSQLQRYNCIKQEYLVFWCICISTIVGPVRLSVALVDISGTCSPLYLCTLRPGERAGRLWARWGAAPQRTRKVSSCCSLQRAASLPLSRTHHTQPMFSPLNENILPKFVRKIVISNLSWTTNNNFYHFLTRKYLIFFIDKILVKWWKVPDRRYCYVSGQICGRR